MSTSFPGFPGSTDPALVSDIVDIMSKVPPNPLTGAIGPTEMQRYYKNNMTPRAQEVLLRAQKAFEESQRADLSSFNFASLASTIKRNIFWRISLTFKGNLDVQQDRLYGADAIAYLPGLRPLFVMKCSVYGDRECPDGNDRLVGEYKGLPSSKDVLDFVRRCIAIPIPMRPALPESLVITDKLRKHADALRPFLNSLPAPFRWRVESPELADALSEVAYAGSKHRAKAYLDLGRKSKDTGNSLFNQKDRQGALTAYKKTIHCAELMQYEEASKDQTQEMNKLLTVCHANIAAAYLLPGDGMDARAALRDAELVEYIDPDFAKGYSRQARAYQVMGEIGKAQDAIARGLRRANLRNHEGLVDCLIEFQTRGKGLPNTREGFERWMEDVLKNNKESANRMKDVGGRWRQVCGEHHAKLFGHSK